MRFSRVRAGLRPSVLDAFKSFRVIFDYTREKATASIRPSATVPSSIQWSLQSGGGFPKRRGRELRLLRLQLFFNHRFHDGLQNLSRTACSISGFIFASHSGNQVIHAGSRRLRGLWHRGLYGFLNRVKTCSVGSMLLHECVASSAT